MNIIAGGDNLTYNTTDIREKDVINICTGKRIGYICDFVIDASCGRIVSIIVSCNYFSLIGSRNAVCIPWEKVVCIGDDAVLVSDEGDILCDSAKETKRFGREEKKRCRCWFF